MRFLIVVLLALILEPIFPVFAQEIVPSNSEYEESDIQRVLESRNLSDVIDACEIAAHYKRYDVFMTVYRGLKQF